MLQLIVQALTNKSTEGKTNFNYYAEYKTESPTLSASVEGIGKLNFPLSQDTIHNLLQHSEQAKFGLRSQTLTDKSIRDTQEISSRYLDVHLEEDVLKTILDNARQKLALSDGAKLSAHLHNLLIYGPGQFFKPHRDSEKLDGMVATLVIVLPSPHIGGDLLINHKKDQHRFISENLDQTGLNCIAFYADCYHEVEKIKQGYRVALTYNVVLQPSDGQNQYPENTALEVALKDYFQLPESNQIDTNLIYYFDHSYTEHSLRWDLLKGHDHHHARSFLQAAKKLDLVPYLALVEIHESWTTDGDDDDPTPEDLIENSTCLNFWINEHNQPEAYQRYCVDDDEVCWSTATEDLEPDETEQEGWMGNYGNTVDYWYRRAAIVLWPRQAQIRMDFRLNHDKAMRDVFKLSKEKNHEQEIIDIINQARSYFHQSGHPSKTEQRPFEQYIGLALYIKNEVTALFILTNYPLDALNQSHAKPLLALQQQYGVTWCLSLLEQWKNKSTSSYRDSALIKSLSQLIDALVLAGLDIKIMDFLVEYQFKTLVQYNERWKNARPVELKNSFSLRLDILNDIFRASMVLSLTRFTESLIEYIISNIRLYPPTELAAFLIQWMETVNFQSTSWCASLLTHVTQAIQQELDKGLRSEQDKSINQGLSCKCEYCKDVSAFLQSPSETTKVYSVKQDIRQHITGAFAGLGIPVELTEERKGSPYKLVIKKNENIFQVAHTRYAALKIYQNKLESSQCARSW